MLTISALILRQSEARDWKDMSTYLGNVPSIHVRETADVEEAVQIIDGKKVDIVLADYDLSGTNPLTLLRHIRSLKPHVEVIFFSHKASLSRAIESMKAGAFDFYEFPVNPRLIRAVMEKAAEKQTLYFEKKQLEQRVREQFDYGNIIGRGKAMREMLNRIASVAPKNVNVLVTGETGTGKEMVANAIHFNSPRTGRPYVKLNCSVFNEGVLESELFGHEKGAFTGALSQRTGRLELADGGTVFLDEVGDMPLATQVKLLRVLQEKEFERVGGNQAVRVDVRVIAATHQDLRQLALEGRFREDLYYRLNVVHLHLPPLRERKEDIPLLVDYFLQNLPKKVEISSVALQMIMAYTWPGNIRELKNVIESAAVIAENGFIEPAQLPGQITGAFMNSDSKQASLPVNLPLDERINEIEKSMIIEALRKTGGVQVRATELLGINQRSLWHRIKKHGIDVKSIKNYNL